MFPLFHFRILNIQTANMLPSFNKLVIKISFKGEDTLWNISFRLFRENSIAIHLIWFHEIHIKYVKRKLPTIKKKGIQKKPEACNFIKKETLAQVFSCEFCEISKNTFYRTPLDDCFCSIEKKSAFFSGNKEIAQRNAILSQENM